mmetsp:Transcript_13022/g.34645  ORF Transcript_13022/g.34645 Transcript_13022/m.34645 type:complete len:94 (-) Transcript_13022:353-634(-)
MDAVASRSSGSKDPAGASTTKSGGSLKSALRKRTNGVVEEKSPRWDKNGVMISPKSGGHHLTFADQQERGKIEEIHEVKAFKNNQGGCVCVVS